MKFNIWREGYLCTGLEGIPETARCLGEWDGKNFKEACINWSKVTKSTTFNADRLTDWACRLLDNEADARKQFG